jgi:hypothetical protein
LAAPGISELADGLFNLLSALTRSVRFIV